jgi:hypothetical protein
MTLGRKRLNEVSRGMEEDYEEQLSKGGPFIQGGTATYRIDTLDDNAGRPANRGFDAAYLRALLYFRNGNTENAREALDGARCNRDLPENPATAQDIDAPQRSMDILCEWLGGRIAVDEANGGAGNKLAGAVAQLRAALQAALASSAADRDAGGATTTAFPDIPVLRPQNYMMQLPEAAGAALWQDYLSALALSANKLCDEACDKAQKRTEDGKLVMRLVRGAPAELWQKYPELGTLSRFLLARQGWIAEARRIRINLNDLEPDQPGFQIVRNGGAQVTLHPDWKTLNDVTWFAVADLREETPPPASLAPADDAVRFWQYHANARRSLLADHSAGSNPFGVGSPQRAAYKAFDAEWRIEISGRASLRQIAVYWGVLALIAAALAYLILIVWKPVRNLVLMHEREWRDVMNSWYFTAPQDADRPNVSGPEP